GHGPSQHGADRMWDGVMDVQQIQLLGLEDLKHFGGECQSVRRIVEEWVGSYLDFVEKDVRVVQVHADGRGVADEMDVVAAGSQLLAELGGHDSRAAISGVAGYANANDFEVSRPLRG